LNWRATQRELKMQGLRRTFGLAEPIRREMELQIAREGEWRADVLGGSAGLHGDILEGRDWSLEWEDVFVGEYPVSFLAVFVPVFPLWMLLGKLDDCRC
jgi:proteasome maturation protein